MIRKKLGGILAASALVCATTVAMPVNAQTLENETNNDNVIQGRSTTSVGTVVNCPEGLNMRKGAGTNTTILRLLPNGTKVNVLGSTNGWYRIEYNNIYGYVYGQYLNVKTTTNETSMNATGKVTNTTGVGLNLRSSASTSSTVLMTIREGESLKITAKNGAWYKVNYSNKVGYVHSDYVTLVNDTVVTPPVQTTPPANPETSMNATGKVTNTTGVGLNLRSSASTSSSVLMTIKEGESLKITAKNGAWYKVNYSNKVGYVHSDYVTVVNNNVTTPSQPTNPETSMSANGKVTNTTGVGLNLRSSASTSSTVLMTIKEGETLKITAKSGSWYKVSYSNKVGYVHSDYVTLVNDNGDVEYKSNGYVGDTEGLGLYMRTAPSTSASVVMTIPEGAVISITAKNGNWYKVTYNGKTGYAYAEYIELGDKPTNNKATFERVFAIMKEHIGTPYVWGGSGEYITDASIAKLKARFPYEAADGWYDYIGRKYYNNGYRAFDCSGLMQWGFAQVGINIGRTTYNQVNYGTPVSKADVQPGDLVFTKSQDHVGMYVGNGQWIESPAPGYSIRISNINWNSIGYIRRLL